VDQIETPRPESRLRLVVRSLVSLAIVVGIFVGVLPLFADYSDVWATIRTMTTGEVVWLLAVGAVNIVTYWFLMVAVLPGLTVLQAGVVNQASTAVANTMPGGGALGVGVSWAMYRSWGFSTAEFAQATVLSGVWNNFVKLAMPVLALAFVAFTGDAEPVLVSGAVLGISVLIGVVILFALMLRSERLAFRVGEWAGRLASAVLAWVRRRRVEGWGAAAADFCNRSAVLVKRRWAFISVTAVLSHAALFVVLLVSLRLVGIGEDEVGWIAVLAAFALVRLASAIPITPGGVGLVELGFVALLGVGLDDPARARLVAAVLLFRVVAFVFPIPIGFGAFLFWRGNRSWRRSPGEREGSAGGEGPLSR